MPHAEVLDFWTTGQAYEAAYGQGAPRPDPEVIDESMLCEIDAALASFFGEATIENRKKAAAALHFIIPRIATYPLQLGPTGKDRQRAHITAVVTRAVEKYLDERDMPISERKSIAKAFREWEFDGLNYSDWFVIYDALGTSGENTKDMVIFDFYKFAKSYLTYLQMQETL